MNHNRYIDGNTIKFVIYSENESCEKFVVQCCIVRGITILYLLNSNQYEINIVSIIINN